MSDSLFISLPEIILSLGSLVLLMVAAFGGDRQTRLVSICAVALLIAAAAVAATQPGGIAFDGLYRGDAFSAFAKVLIFAGAAVAVILAPDFFGRNGGELRAEYPILILLSSVGMGMMVSATDLLTLYVGLELQSLAAYVLASFMRRDARSAEAGLKYFILGALASGILLYGIALLYGFTGTTQYAGIALGFADTPESLGLLFGLVFALAGIAFKISAVPFHMWTPDVYEGAPTAVTAFFAAAPKVAAMAMAVRFFVGAMPGAIKDWQQIIVFVSIASMALGAFAAIGQRNIKRLLAYSSIANMGFALVGLAAGTAEGVQGVATYMAIYLAMTLGAFACVLMMRRDGQLVESIDDLAGLSRTNPWMAFALGMIMFSLAGIPPLAGFWAKFYVFLAAINAQLYVLAVVGVVTSVVGAYYYLRIVKVMYFDAGSGALDPRPASLTVVMAASGLVTLLFFLFPAVLIGAAQVAVSALVG